MSDQIPQPDRPEDQTGSGTRGPPASPSCGTPAGSPTRHAPRCPSLHRVIEVDPASHARSRTVSLLVVRRPAVVEHRQVDDHHARHQIHDRVAHLHTRTLGPDPARHLRRRSRAVVHVSWSHEEVRCHIPRRSVPMRHDPDHSGTDIGPAHCSAHDPIAVRRANDYALGFEVVAVDGHP